MLEAQQLLTSSASSATAAQHRMVWVVDDSPLDAQNACASLGAGFATRIFNEGAQMLEQLSSAPPPEVLLLDWVMPTLSGLEICRFLRAREKATGPSALPLSILLLTAQSEPHQVVEGLAAGADDYLPKPYSPSMLVARVTSLIRARRQRDRVESAGYQAADDALHREDLRHRALIEGMRDLVIVIRDGRIAFMNPLALAIFANGNGEKILGQPIESILHPDDREMAVARIAAAIERGSPSLVEHRMLRHDGSQVEVDLSTQAVIFDNALAVVVVGRDISAHKQAQSQLMVTERMDLVGMLAAGVAHEINNPMASVLANLDYALHELRGDLKPVAGQAAGFAELEQALGEARQAGDRVGKIIRDLKIFSRVESDALRGAIDIERLLESILRVAQPEIRPRARLVRDFGTVAPVLANETLLGQVFLNLIVNACQAISDGHPEENEIRITTRMIGDQVAIEVRDTGAGMSPTVLKKLFTPFFTTRPVGAGTGIGLSICHRIISGLGGAIQVESQVGVGTTFRVSLPATPAEAPVAVPIAVAPVAAVLRRGKVLVVDDEEAITRVLSRMFRSEHEVVGVLNGKLALELIAGGQQFDVILCDLMMPQMTGMELHARLLVVDPAQATRMIFLSGGTFTASARAFLDTVPNARFEKPFDAQLLRGIVTDRVRALA